MLKQRKKTKKQKYQLNGAILWEGPSEIDGKPIVVIVNGLKNASKNDKTGEMLQTWILRTDIGPKEAAHNGEDFSICGNCTHRMRYYIEGLGFVARRTCYVNLRVPIQVFKCYQKGRYLKADDETRATIKKSHLRAGSYGDPMALPYEIWEMYLPSDALHRTGYTHQWAEDWGQDERFKNILMASVDTRLEQIKAQVEGWRTFFVKPEGDTSPIQGFQCPSDPILDTHLSCFDCGACHGAPKGNRKVSPEIYAHGPTKKRVGRTSFPLFVLDNARAT